MSEEWGPWIEHDGKGCPCVGEWVHVVRRDGRQSRSIAGAMCSRRGVDPNGPDSAWVWTRDWRSGSEVIRYRICRPKGMAILLANIASIPTDLDTDVPVEVLNPELAE